MIKAGTVLLTTSALSLVDAVGDTFSSIEARLVKSAELVECRPKGPCWVFVDWLLPEMSGLALCERLRDTGLDEPLHITMVLPEADQAQQARALAAGADDYITGPLTPEALVDRLRLYQPSMAVRSDQPTIHIGDLQIDRTSHTTRFRGALLALRSNEQRLLYHFARFPNKVFTRSELIGVLGKSSEVAEERTVDVWVSRLRRKLRSHNVPHLPRTVRAYGYIFDVGEA